MEIVLFAYRLIWSVKEGFSFCCLRIHDYQGHSHYLRCDWDVSLLDDYFTIWELP